MDEVRWATLAQEHKMVQSLKSLADLKKTLRGRGFVLPGDEAPEAGVAEAEASGAEVVEEEAPEAGVPVEAAAVAG